MQWEQKLRGDPLAGQFVDTFRYLNQLGSLAQRGVRSIMHNTLASSDYGKEILRTFRSLGAASAVSPSSTAIRTLFAGRVVRHFGAENATHWTYVGFVSKTVVFAAIVMIEQDRLFAFNAVDSLAYVKFPFVR